ncbi:DUF418 domain-containing protein [Erythrobacter sp. JK5]|uniref:DUF418 domain-containing protein n=1 Tax=Erythrobacter sp. JK5 TaxID=2829500 RepID=UPI001BAD407D|nr:DUF418 domain-containing protein [Erythrobacter sp. JK5]QUL37537.1 DUF418 domain-containing protein [Erythrobacter sp. JK5]
MTTPAPSSAGRIAELDALRGLAVIGIVWMNVYVFALPAQAYYNPVAYGGESSLDRLVWAASFVFVEDKFRTLFAMMFGAGCIILLEKGGGRPWRAHFARMAVLFAIGLVHATLLASNDILRAYAIAGCALPFLAQLPVRALVAVAVGLVAVHVGGGIVVFGSGFYDWAQGRSWTEMALLIERDFGSDARAIGFALEQGRESFAERVSRRLDGMPSQLATIVGSVPINLAAMALGMALWKDRMLAGEWRTFRLQRLAAVCAVLSIPPLLWLAQWTAQEGFPGPLVGPVALGFSAPFDTALGLAYAALAMALFDARGAVTRRLAAVGRLSLTNYLMTSAMLGAIFASWGLGLFAQVSRAQAFALGFVPIATMLLWSPLWVARLGQGPFERLWRGSARLLG